MKSLTLFALFFSILLFTACNKVPGEGGTSSIAGKVLVYNVNSDGDITSAEYNAMDTDVFIIYGDGSETYNDNFKTSFDGSYRFDYLTPGKYTVFAYSECSTCLGLKDVKSHTVEITDKKQVIEAADLIIFD